jgi:hypothetical protein
MEMAELYGRSTKTSSLSGSTETLPFYHVGKASITEKAFCRCCFSPPSLRAIFNGFTALLQLTGRAFGGHVFSLYSASEHLRSIADNADSFTISAPHRATRWLCERGCVCILDRHACSTPGPFTVFPFGGNLRFRTPFMVHRLLQLYTTRCSIGAYPAPSWKHFALRQTSALHHGRIVWRSAQCPNTGRLY